MKEKTDDIQGHAGIADAGLKRTRLSPLCIIQT